MGIKKYYIKNNGGHMEDFEKLLSVKQVSEKTGLTETHIRALVFRKKIPYLKIGGLIKFSPNEIISWLKTREVK